MHKNWDARVHRDPYDVSSKVIASEFRGTGISSPSRQTPGGAERKANPHCLLVSSEKCGFGVIEVAYDRIQVSLRVLDDVTKEYSGIDTLARLVVADGKPVCFA